MRNQILCGQVVQRANCVARVLRDIFYLPYFIFKEREIFCLLDSVSIVHTTPECWAIQGQWAWHYLGERRNRRGSNQICAPLWLSTFFSVDNSV